MNKPCTRQSLCLVFENIIMDNIMAKSCVRLRNRGGGVARLPVGTCLCLGLAEWDTVITIPTYRLDLPLLFLRSEFNTVWWLNKPWTRHRAKSCVRLRNIIHRIESRHGATPDGADLRRVSGSPQWFWDNCFSLLPYRNKRKKLSTTFDAGFTWHINILGRCTHFCALYILHLVVLLQKLEEVCRTRPFGCDSF